MGHGIWSKPRRESAVLQAEQGQIQIHTENIFPIIKKAVYSGHEVFLRELVSNGVDAISKRRMAAMAGDCSEGSEGRIQIRISREAKPSRSATTASA